MNRLLTITFSLVTLLSWSNCDSLSEQTPKDTNRNVKSSVDVTISDSDLEFDFNKEYEVTDEELKEEEKHVEELRVRKANGEKLTESELATLEMNSLYDEGDRLDKKNAELDKQEAKLAKKNVELDKKNAELDKQEAELDKKDKNFRLAVAAG